MNASTIKPGDRVRINAPRATFHNKAGRVAYASSDRIVIFEAIDRPRWSGAFEFHQVRLAPRMSLPARTLLAAWHASDRRLVKITDNVCGLHRIRRYGVEARDGLTADLTLTTEVQL